MRKKLVNWQTESLSLAGKTCAGPIYSLYISGLYDAVLRLLMSVCKGIDKICRDFLWRDTNAKK